MKSHLYLRDAVMAFKCMTGLSPSYLSNKFISRGSISGRPTRNSQKLNIPLCKSATGPEVLLLPYCKYLEHYKPYIEIESVCKQF